MWPFRKTTVIEGRYIGEIAPTARRTPSPCEASLYEPGADHEHYCLATRPHGALDHTCAYVPRKFNGGETTGPRCCKTWSDEEPKREDNPLQLDPDLWMRTDKIGRSR